MVLMGNKLVAEYIGRIIDTRRPETIERTDLFRLDSYASSTSCDLGKISLEYENARMDYHFLRCFRM